MLPNRQILGCSCVPHVGPLGSQIYWEEHGSGPPVLLIMGLSFSLEMWYRLVPGLVGHCRVILFDNRGVGRSDVPRGPYTIPQMARDAAAVLQAAGASQAHVIGASMGGMIAQELALRYPKLVLSLVLACTSHGGLLARWPQFIPPRKINWEDRRQREMDFARFLYSPSTPMSRIEEDIEVRCRGPWSYKGFLGQLSGIVLWSSYLRLPAIRVPTLVIHGDRDLLVPAQNGRVVAARIPGAEFRLIQNAAHMLTTDQPQVCEDLLEQFLARVGA